MGDWRIGGSQAATVLGLGWSTPLQLYAELLGIVPRDEAESEAAYWGKALEVKVMARYASDQRLHVVRRAEQGGDDTYQVLAPTGSYWHVTAGGNHPFNDAIELLSLQHPELQWQTGTPDGIALRPRMDGYEIVEGVEAKTSSEWRRREWGDEGTDDIPDEYIAQPQQYMGIARALGHDIDRWAVPALIGGQRYKLFRVAFDQGYYDDLVAAEADFIRRLDERDPPKAIAGDVPMLAQLFPEAFAGTVVEAHAGGPLEAIARRYANAASTIKAATTDKDAAMAELLQQMGEAEKMQGEGWSISWKVPKPGRKVDWPAVVDELVRLLQLKASAEDATWARELLARLQELEGEHTTTTEYKRRAYPSRLATLVDG